MAQRTTKRYGTPCSPAWDDAWIAVVEESEKRHGKALCGARTLAGTPCTLAANHENGRCKFHGGFNCTGAQPGNRNAVLHGLYARGLQRCGRHCPQWEHCPLASEEVDQLPKHNRPRCPYEVAQFQMAETDLETRTNAHGGLERHALLQAALLEVMVCRAGAALAITGATETSEVNSEKYSMRSSKPSAALTAYLKLTAEHRRALAELKPDWEYEPDFEAQVRDAERHRMDSQVSPEAQAVIASTVEMPGMEASKEYLESAEYYVSSIRATRDRCEKEIEGGIAALQKVREENLARNGGVVHESETATAESACDALRNGPLAQRVRQEAQSKIDEMTESLRNEYHRAFTLYPSWRERLQNNPEHDPTCFPEPEEQAQAG